MGAGFLSQPTKHTFLHASLHNANPLWTNLVEVELAHKLVKLGPALVICAGPKRPNEAEQKHAFDPTLKNLHSHRKQKKRNTVRSATPKQMSTQTRTDAHEHMDTNKQAGTMPSSPTTHHKHKPQNTNPKTQNTKHKTQSMHTHTHTHTHTNKP